MMLRRTAGLAFLVLVCSIAQAVATQNTPLVDSVLAEVQRDLQADPAKVNGFWAFVCTEARFTPRGQQICSSTDRARRFVELLLSQGADVDFRNRRGQTPLAGLVIDARWELAELLIVKGANVNIELFQGFGLTPLHEAAAKGPRSTVELLLKHGARADAKDKVGITPLAEAVRANRKDIAQLLVAKGSQPEHLRGLRATPGGITWIGHGTPGEWEKATGRPAPPDLLSEMRGFGPPPPASIKRQTEPATGEKTSRAHPVPTAEQLLTPPPEPPRPFSRLGEGFVPASTKPPEAEPSIEAAQVIATAKTGDARALRSLLAKHKEAVRACDENGATPLHWAADRGDASMVTELLVRGADVNATKKDGVTPLHVAAALGKEMVVRILLDFHAEIDVRDKAGRTPISVAKARGHTQIARSLESAVSRMPRRAAGEDK